jgi:hypothetical protein
VGTYPKDVDDDFDLDALMARVGEAALTGGTSEITAPPQTAADLTGRDLALVRVVEAQGEWNEHTSKSLAALVECLRTLRDDWTEAETRLRQEVGQLSAIVEEMRASTKAAVARARRPAAKPKRRRGASASRRGTRTRQSINGGRRRR